MAVPLNAAVMSVSISGDIGGLGISRFHFATLSGSDVSSSDCNSALAALHSLYNACQNDFPSSISITFNPDVLAYVISSALPLENLSASSIPSNVNGTGTGGYGAGLGARINWKTSQVRGRHFMRSATFMVPFDSGAYVSSGALNPSAISDVTTGAAAYLNAMATAGLQAIAYHRPAKGTTTGGAFGPINAAFIPPTPAGLRSRRS